MSSWSCKTCPIYPRPPILLKGTTAYQVYGNSRLGTTSYWWRPVYTHPPNNTYTEETFYLNNDETKKISIYINRSDVGFTSQGLERDGHHHILNLQELELDTVTPDLYPNVCAPYYTVCASTDPTSNTKSWWAPVFLSNPGSGLSVEKKTLYVGHKNVPIELFTLPDLDSNVGDVRPSRYTVLVTRPCNTLSCTSSKDQIQRNKDDNIRINVQNGTWCRSPMSSAEHLEYAKAMEGIKAVYKETSC